MILHLKRFSYGNQGSTKLYKRLQFPLQLILNRDLLSSPSSKVINIGYFYKYLLKIFVIFHSISSLFLQGFLFLSSCLLLSLPLDIWHYNLWSLSMHDQYHFLGCHFVLMFFVQIYMALVWMKTLLHVFLDFFSTLNLLITNCGYCIVWYEGSKIWACFNHHSSWERSVQRALYCSCKACQWAVASIRWWYCYPCQCEHGLAWWSLCPVLQTSLKVPRSWLGPSFLLKQPNTLPNYCSCNCRVFVLSTLAACVYLYAWLHSKWGFFLFNPFWGLGKFNCSSLYDQQREYE